MKVFHEETSGVKTIVHTSDLKKKVHHCNWMTRVKNYTHKKAKKIKKYKQNKAQIVNKCN
jgi:hypothetical protein